MVLNRFAEDHLNSFKKILNFKKPVFIDKPISEDLDSTIKIINLAKENQVPITSHSPLEFCSELKDIQKQIENNKKNSIKTLVNLVYEDTVELKAGLESSDTGERRSAALESFNSNLDQLTDKISEIVASASS